MAIQNIENVLQTIAADAYVPAEAVTKLSVFAHNYSQDLNQPFDTVHVPVVAAGSAKVLNLSNGYVSDGELSVVPVTLDQQLYSSMDISLQTFAKFANQTHAATATGQAAKVARKMMQAIADKVDADTSIEISGNGRPGTFAGLKWLKTHVASWAAPILVLNPETYDALVTDKDVMHLAALSGKDLLATGTIADLCGFKVVRADITTGGFVCDAGAIAFATALTAIDSNASQPIVDEKSGCAMLVKYIDNGNPPTVTALTEILFGCAVIDASRVQKFVESDGDLVESE